ncbi:MAG: putative phosphothreonine lyase domain-containing protein [bacterium]
MKSDHRKPSQVTDEYWLYAIRQTGDYPEDTANSGKWLVFSPMDKVDDLWQKIKVATEEGRLGSASKAATARPNSLARDARSKVLCIYTYDWTDREDVMRVRAELRKLGVTAKIPYKADADTTAGRYASPGKRRISKYFA